MGKKIVIRAYDAGITGQAWYPGDVDYYMCRYAFVGLFRASLGNIRTT